MRSKLFQYIFALFLMSCMMVAQAKTTTMNQIELLNTSNQSQIIFSAKEPILYHSFILSNPDRLVVDFANATLKYDENKISMSKSGIQQVKIGHPDKDTLRVVFYLNPSVTSSASILKPQGHLGYRLIIHFSSSGVPVIDANAPEPISVHSVKTLIKSPKIVKEKPSVLSVVSPESVFDKPTVTKTVAEYQNNSSNDVVVVIDPGHGGHDPGAIGQMGTREKNVVLQIAKNLYDILNHQPGIKPYMTRYTDNFVSLRGRLKFARMDKANIFVAIHADAFYDHEAQGATVFALSLHGATSEAARWLAERENYSELSGVSLSDKNQLLRSVLLDLTQTSTISQSVVFGNQVRDSLGSVTRLHSHIVEQAAFVVLKSPDIPSILVETGFLSNEQQEEQLETGDFQMKVAQAIADGIINYLHQNPPVGTVFAKAELK